MTDPSTIIARCTRNGITSWQAVAKQMGLSVDAVRSRYDAAYLKVRPWPHPCEAVPHPDGAKGPGLKALILNQLGKHAMSVEDLAYRLQRPVNSIRARLAQMRQCGLVESDSGGRHNGKANAWTWWITTKGRDVTRCAIQGSEAI